MKITASLIVALCAAKNLERDPDQENCEKDGTCLKKETRSHDSFNVTFTEETQTGVSGTITMDGYEVNQEDTWKIQSDCEQIRIISSSFDIQYDYDTLNIEGRRYSGEKAIDHVICTSDAELVFTSDYEYSDFDGFELSWECAPACLDLSGTSGTIKMDGYTNYDEGEWNVESDCETVRIVSRSFDTQYYYDVVLIDEEHYHGKLDDSIEQIVPGSFVISFEANYDYDNHAGFELFWECEDICRTCLSTGYTIEPGVDYHAGDLKELLYLSFDECVLSCKTTADCIAVRYNTNGCYLKHTIGAESQPGFGTAGRKCELVQSCFKDPAFNPCPSDECWTFDESTNECNMKSECSTLTCGATAFDISFAPQLFGLTDAQTDVSFAAGFADSPPTRYPDPTGALWKVSSPLGSNGMTYTIDTDDNTIMFEVQISLDGSGETSLGAKSIVMKTGADVKFQCTYPMIVELTSEIFTVEEVTVKDASVATGSLDGGFEMTLNNDESANIMLGAILPVSITWAASELGFFTFYPVVCTVTHGATEIAIVKDGCFSGEIGALAGTPNGDLKMVDFSFRVFKGFEEEGTDQTMACSIQICHEDQCGKPTEDSQCPSTADDVFYKYTVVGSL